MSYIAPHFRHPDQALNELGLSRRDYEGALSTLCAGCGHDSISAAVVQASFELSLPPHRFAKISGIGCSSKTPTYFLGRSHGFNSVHGRMPSVASGANLANGDLHYVAVSGDGDTASIGIGQFVHVIRRNIDMLYLLENNGCYGLTKGQDSATTDIGSKAKAGHEGFLPPIDLCAMALQLGAGFVARSFSGDKQQLVPLIKAAIKHRGFAFIDVISPCVTFNNNAESTKSYSHARSAIHSANVVDYVPERAEISADYAPGDRLTVPLHNGGEVVLRKADSDFQPGDAMAALNAMQRATADGEILTGLLYLDPDKPDLHSMLQTSTRHLAGLGEEELCPGTALLEQLNEECR